MGVAAAGGAQKETRTRNHNLAQRRESIRASYGGKRTR